MSMHVERRLVVIGLGYVGLPLVVEACKAGFSVVGLDVSETIVSSLNGGVSHVDDISDGELRICLDAGFRASSDPTCLDDCDVVVICVPTPLDEHSAPDLSAVKAATSVVADHLQSGILVVLESTTYPGTTDGVVREILETSGLKAGVDFSLAFSPERIDPGNLVYTLRNTPKVVGGLTPASTAKAVEFYSQIVDTVVPVSGTKEAELTKLLENTFRHVNIALVNEMSIFCHELGIDLWEVIEAASTKPFGFTAFYPGPGVGGHCIPIDPNYLSYRVKSLGYQFRFVELAQEISGRMPSYVVRRIQDTLNDDGKSVNGSRILLLGLTYKQDIADDRETPARPIIRLLTKLGAEVVIHDDHLRKFTVDGCEIDLAEDLDSELSKSDLTVLLQPHGSYDLDRVAQRSRLVFDTRGRMRHPNVVRL